MKKRMIATLSVWLCTTAHATELTVQAALDSLAVSMDRVLTYRAHVDWTELTAAYT